MIEIIKKMVDEINECKKKHSELCKERDYPDFTPKSGQCWKCGRDIYQNYIIDDMESYGETGERFITGCPHCHRSYCD
ncbi:MAG: hypothetical protein E7J31_09890 [Clostridium sp.]|uniref:hypothetical protein n=1 Tax=Clostridium sp. TaxID=1506 RepID=UPI00290FA009|nr:hypothetical protein [Clostridium sp.]MDU7948740.1 hypothetical protein [Clostridium sp.]